MPDIFLDIDTDRRLDTTIFQLFDCQILISKQFHTLWPVIWRSRMPMDTLHTRFRTLIGPQK